MYTWNLQYTKLDQYQIFTGNDNLQIPTNYKILSDSKMYFNL